MKSKQTVFRMVGIALLMALVVVLQTVGSMIPSVGGFSISLVLIPIVVGSAVYGPLAGGILGATFGVVVYINCVTGADVGGAMVFQADPLLCLLVVLGKGILCGVAAGWTYRLLKRFNTYVAMLVAAIVCPLVNTGVFVACMCLFFNDILSAWASGGDLVGYILSGLLLVNMVPEIIINVAFSPAGARIARAVGNRS